MHNLYLTAPAVPTRPVGRAALHSPRFSPPPSTIVFLRAPASAAKPRRLRAAVRRHASPGPEESSSAGQLRVVDRQGEGEGKGEGEGEGEEFEVRCIDGDTPETGGGKGEEGEWDAVPDASGAAFTGAFPTDELLLLPLAALIGSLVAPGVFVFKEGLEVFREVEWGAISEALGSGMGTSVPPGVVAPVMAGFVVSFLKRGGGGLYPRRFAFSPPLKLMSNAAAAGKDDKEAWLPRNLIPGMRKALAGVVTLGSGASLGTEAPSAELGANLALAAGRAAGASSGAASALLAMGAAAGIAASFECPLGGAIYSMEYLLVPKGRLTPSIAAALVLCSYTADGVVQVLSEVTGRGRELSFPEELGSVVSFEELVLFGGMGLVCAAAAILVYEATQVARLTLRPLGALRAPTAGVITGLIAFAFPAVGFGVMPIDVIVRNSDNLPVLDQLSYAGAKVVASAVCAGGGLVGGLFLPSLAVGGFLGSALGGVAITSRALGIDGFIGSTAGLPMSIQDWVADALIQGLESERFAMVGAAAVMGATCRCPVTACVMIVELTGEPGLIPALAVATGVSTFLTYRGEGKVGEWAAALVAPTEVDDLTFGYQEQVDAEEDFFASIDEEGATGTPLRPEDIPKPTAGTGLLDILSKEGLDLLGKDGRPPGAGGGDAGGRGGGGAGGGGGTSE